MSETPKIGERVRFITPNNIVWQGTICDIRPTFAGERIAYVSVLGWPEMLNLALDTMGFTTKREGVWRAK